MSELLKGRRFDSLNEMTDALDALAGDTNWRTAHEDAAGWYCTQPSDDDGIIDLFFIPPLPYATRHGLNTIPLGGPRGWGSEEGPNGLTVTPSIFINPNGNPPGWHGFLTDGQWSTV